MTNRKAKKPHGIQMNSVVRALTLLDVLKEHTDREHKLPQDAILKIMKEKCSACTEKTLRTDLHNLMKVLNPLAEEFDAEDFQEFKDEFRIMYDGIETGRSRISGVQYIHEFTDDELDLLIAAVKGSSELDENQISALEEKLKMQGSLHYQKKYKYGKDSIQEVSAYSTVTKTHLQQNRKVIQDAIRQNKMISFVFNMYNREGKLVPKREKRYMVNPYYIVIYGAKYYLLASMGKHENVQIYRLDLMTDAQIEDEKRKNMRDIPELAHATEAEYMEKHLNMYYDKPCTIKIKIDRTCYGYIHDAFGEKYTFIRELDDTYDEVEVVCSENAMVEWAITYCNSTEVIRPLALRKKICEKLMKLQSIYGANLEKYLLIIEHPEWNHDDDEWLGIYTDAASLKRAYRITVDALNDQIATDKMNKIYPIGWNDNREVAVYCFVEDRFRRLDEAQIRELFE